MGLSANILSVPQYTVHVSLVCVAPESVPPFEKSHIHIYIYIYIYVYIYCLVSRAMPRAISIEGLLMGTDAVSCNGYERVQVYGMEGTGEQCSSYG